MARQFNLPSGKVAEITDFKGMHVRDAHGELAEKGTDIGGLLFVLISKVVTVDGKPVTFDMLDEMPGTDVVFLQNEFSSAIKTLDKTNAATLAANERRLPSGRIAKIEEFLGKHVREAQRQIADMQGDLKDKGEEANMGTMLFVLMSMLVTIDGQSFVYEDINEMDGMDVLALEGEFSAANFR